MSDQEINTGFNVCEVTTILTLNLHNIAYKLNRALEVKLFLLEPRGGCNLFSRNYDYENHPPYFLFVANAPLTPEGRTSLGQFFRDVGDSEEVGLYVRKRDEIQFRELEHEYQASGYYDVKDGVLEGN